ncbi:MAG: CrcB protein [Pseudomonadota bacterium]|jgi:CrcB protein
MTLFALISVFVGAGFGACLRYVLGLGLNPLFPPVPLGTLAANLLGAYLAGAIAAWLLLRTGYPDALRLFLITGFLGGLTTFSSFSLEMIALLGGGRTGLALLAAAAHLGGSLLLTVCGAWTVRALLPA